MDAPSSSTGFFARSELGRALYAFRREFFIVGLFSMVVNLLMLAPTLYMLQVYDRVLVSRSEVTLVFVSLITLFLFAVMAFAEWSRSRLLVRTGVRLDAVLGTRVFNASFEANLSHSGAPAQRAFQDLIELRQFLTGNGTIAFFDLPWMPIYLAVLFFLHPFLGYLAADLAALLWGILLLPVTLLKALSQKIKIFAKNHFHYRRKWYRISQLQKEMERTADQATVWAEGGAGHETNKAGQSHHKAGGARHARRSVRHPAGHEKPAPECPGSEGGAGAAGPGPDPGKRRSARRRSKQGRPPPSGGHCP